MTERVTSPGTADEERQVNSFGLIQLYVSQGLESPSEIKIKSDERTPRFVPVMVINVPPATGPCSGEIEVIAGDGH